MTTRQRQHTEPAKPDETPDEGDQVDGVDQADAGDRAAQLDERERQLAERERQLAERDGKQAPAEPEADPGPPEFTLTLSNGEQVPAPNPAATHHAGADGKTYRVVSAEVNPEEYGVDSRERDRRDRADLRRQLAAR